MKNILAPFEEPIYITSPISPSENEILSEYRKIKESKCFTNFGKQHDLLEQTLKEYLKAQHLILYNNGTTALIAGIKALSLKGEIITSSFTFPATVDAILWNNLKPVFCDISPIDYNIDVKKIEESITDKTSAILVLHTFGNPCNTNAISDIAKKYNLKIIYDAAQAFDVYVENKPIASFGDISIFSFHATKIFNTIEGGCVCCKDSETEKKLRLIRNFGFDGENIAFDGLNGKLNEIQASFGLLNLPNVKKEIEKRKNLVEVYYKNLEDINEISILKPNKNTKYNYQYFIISVNQNIDRDYLYNKLKEYNIFTKKYFYPCIDAYPFLKNISNIENAKKASKETLALPLYGDLTKKEIEKICSIIKYIISEKVN